MRFLLQCCIIGGHDDEIDFKSDSIGEIIAKAYEFDEAHVDVYFEFQDLKTDYWIERFSAEDIEYKLNQRYSGIHGLQTELGRLLLHRW